ncbi:MAG: hypothetical protein ACI8S6_000365 [Myxococcota bacterium]|jgi:hypothetical protein
MTMVTILSLVGCLGAAPGSLPPDPLDGPDPSITGVRWSCDVEQALWRFTIEADAWTGGGLIWIARDATLYEEHLIRSVSAEADGSADELALELSIVADWRDASAGSSTRWRCSEEATLSFQAAIFETTGEQQTDCRRWGIAPALWDDIEAVEACAVPLEILDTGEGVR